MQMFQIFIREESLHRQKGFQNLNTFGASVNQPEFCLTAERYSLWVLYVPVCRVD